MNVGRKIVVFLVGKRMNVSNERESEIVASAGVMKREGGRESDKTRRERENN
jgi:hypothetical protein